jgi:hypothetical protein
VSAKIAPVLDALLADLFEKAKRPGDRQVLRVARDEFLALRATASAARRLVAVESLADTVPAAEALVRGVARLARASKATP